MYRQVNEYENQSGGRRRYVNPQPKVDTSSSSQQRKEKRARATTSGLVVGADEGLETQFSNLEIEQEDDKEAEQEDSQSLSSMHSADNEDGMKDEGPVIRPLNEVIADVCDDMSREAHERNRIRMGENADRLDTLEYVVRSHSSRFANLDGKIGTHMSVFPPRGQQASDIRQRLSNAYWAGDFQGCVISLSDEYGIPFRMLLASTSVGKFVETVCQEKVPGCWPQLETGSVVAAQENQCKDMRSALGKANKAYNAHSNWTVGEYQLVFGFPMQRRLLDTGALDDGDNWSVEVVLMNDRNEEYREVLLTCVYEHDLQTQRYTADARTVEKMVWAREDIRKAVNGVTQMFYPRLRWLVDDDEVLTPQGKRRYKLDQKGGKGTGDTIFINPGKAGKGLLKGAGIPSSFKGGGGKTSGHAGAFSFKGGGGKSFDNSGKGDFGGKGKFAGKPMHAGFASQSFGKQAFGAKGDGGKQFGGHGDFGFAQQAFPPQPPGYLPMANLGVPPPPPAGGKGVYKNGSSDQQNQSHMYPDPYQMMQQLLWQKGGQPFVS